jgi:Asp-tRNA(Asn)/Glu-tRNA(Gln) amidotransferase B subunit
MSSGVLGFATPRELSKYESVIGLEVHVQLNTRTKLLLWRAAGTLGMIVDEVIAGNPQQVEQYKTGKTRVLGFLVGQAMRVSNGQANPAAVVNKLLRDKLT